jgi:plastocyanin
MRGLIAIAGVLCLAVLVAPAWSDASTAPTAVGVSEREWMVALGRLKAPHGPITFSVHNYGQDDHNLVIRKLGVQYGSTGRIASGGQRTLTLTLKPGVYNLFCSIPGHRQLGMAAKLTVT